MLSLDPEKDSKTVNPLSKDVDKHILLSSLPITLYYPRLQQLHHFNFTEALDVKARFERHKDAARFFLTSPSSSIPQNSSCTATYIPSRKPSKKDKQEK